MEIAIAREGSFKIKSKNTVFIINPDSKIDGDVVILTEKPSSYSQFQGKLVIDGPGEYEVSGVLIKGEKTDGKISFDFAEDSQSIAVLSTASLAKNKEIEDQTAVVVLLQDGKTDLSGISLSGVLIVVGPKDLLPQDSNIKKLDKINLNNHFFLIFFCYKDAAFLAYC